ncbi:MAG: substrate-binding domain-containing protein [Actinobacteria bacterium]|nr:substrate-binding domain-containing protein [Actinomycetota bacterium]
MKSSRSIGLAVAVLTALCVAVAVAGCGSSGSSATSSTAGDEGTTRPTASEGGTCGTIPTRAPADPDNVLAEFPQSVQAAYNLYSGPISTSAWGDWKPSHPGPYKVFLSMGNIGGDGFSDLFIPGLEKVADESSLIGSVEAESAHYEVQTQIQQVQKAIRDQADLIVFFPLNPSADAAVMEEAGKAGIPVIAPLSASANRYTVGVSGNENLQGATTMGALAPLMKGAGSLLEMQGVPGVPASDGVLEGIDEVLAGCPEIEVVAKPVGNFTEATAKTQTLQTLAAHPQPIDGAIQVGGMSVGIVQAFEQTGREVPPIGDVGGTPGFLAYWSEKEGSYEGASMPVPVGALGESVGYLAAGLLEGRGMKVNEILQTPLLITNQNLNEWVDPEWSLLTPLVYPPGSRKDFYPPEYLEEFFAKPAK